MIFWLAVLIIYSNFIIKIYILHRKCINMNNASRSQNLPYCRHLRLPGRASNTTVDLITSSCSI